MAVRNPFARRHPFGEEELSAYLDGRLSAAESARLDGHLSACEPCRRHLEELRAVVEGLRAVPSVPAPRSFALRQEQVEAPQRPVVWAFGPAGAAAAALLVFVVLVGVDLGTLDRQGASEEAQVQTTAETAYEAEPRTLGAAPAPTLAPVPAARSAVEEDTQAGLSEKAADAMAPEESPVPVEPATRIEEEEGGAGRWVLRGFQAVAGTVFLAALAALLWQRWQRRAAGHA